MIASKNENPSLVGPLLVWIVPQLTALIAGALGVRLWAHFPGDESLALSELLVMQVLLSSLLFPLFCRTAETAMATVLAALPFIAQASYLSAAPLLPTTASAAFLALWILGLAMWSKAAISPPAHLIAIATIFSVNILGALLVYLHAEGSDTNPFWTGAIPLVGIVRLAQGSDYTGFSGVLFMLMLTLAARAFIRVRISTPVIH